MYPGIGERMTKELTALAPSTMKIKVQILIQSVSSRHAFASARAHGGLAPLSCCSLAFVESIRVDVSTLPCDRCRSFLISISTETVSDTFLHTTTNLHFFLSLPSPRSSPRRSASTPSGLAARSFRRSRPSSRCGSPRYARPRTLPARCPHAALLRVELSRPSANSVRITASHPPSTPTKAEYDESGPAIVHRKCF